MNGKRIMTPVALVLALAMSGVPALAQSRERSAQRRQDNRSGRSTTSRERGDNRAARAPEGSDRGSRETVGAQRSAVPRAAPRVDSRRDDYRAYDSRQYDARQRGSQQYDTRQYDARRYDTRRYAVPRYDTRRYDNRWLDGRWYANRAYVPGYYSRSYRSGSIVRFGLGFSIFAGRPFAFTFGYGRTPAYAYRYPMRAGIAYGGMSFLVDPDDAEVYIDGVFVGQAREFGGQPVPVSAGYHRVELFAPGFEGAVYDVTVMPGQVIPYRGSLVPAY